MNQLQLGVSLVGLLACSASAQSINIRFGPANTAPTSAYAGAGLPGRWNSFLVPAPNVRQPLVNLAGVPIDARLYQIGNASIFSHDNPLTSGDDGALLDHMILSTNSPTDGCFWVEGLLPGPYEVTIYALTPNSTTLLNRCRVDNATPGPVMVGGTWPGQHQSGVTFARFNVTTTNGVIGLHDGLFDGMIQSGLNGFQLRFLGACNAPVITGQPRSEDACPGRVENLQVLALGVSAYRWQVETPAAPGGWTDLVAGPLVLNSLIIGTIAGPATSVLNVTYNGVGLAAAPRFRCIVANGCGATTSQPATLAFKSADINHDGSADQDDIAMMVDSVGGVNPPWDADLNNDGNVDQGDVDALVTWIAGGPCP